MPKLYFEDTGLKNILQRGNFATNLEGADLETAIYSLFRKNLEIETIHFWRTKSKQEIDFIIETPEQLLAFEVKINLRKRDGSCLSRFKQYYPESQVFLVGLNWLETKKTKLSSSLSLAGHFLCWGTVPHPEKLNISVNLRQFFFFP
jgi:hypothetical protein